MVDTSFTRKEGDALKTAIKQAGCSECGHSASGLMKDGTCLILGDGIRCPRADFPPHVGGFVPPDPSADKKINTDPEVVGYWCAVRGLAIEDLLGVPTYADFVHLWTQEDHDKFKTGFQNATEELEADRVLDASNKLHDDLRLAYEKPVGTR